MYQIRLHGRGGQGVVTAAEMLSVAAFMEGHFAQAFPSFGSERTGAPVVAFARVDEKAIEISALTTASGEDKASTASISAIAGNNFTDYSKGDKVWVNFIVTCGTETSEQQRIQTDALVEA